MSRRERGPVRTAPRARPLTSDDVELSCRLTRVADQAVLVVQGEVDMATVPVLRDQLARAVAHNPAATVFVDLDGVTVLDDTGLGVLLGAAAAARFSDGDMQLICSSDSLVERFAITGLDRAITVRSRIAPARPGG